MFSYFILFLLGDAIYYSFTNTGGKGITSEALLPYTESSTSPNVYVPCPTTITYPSSGGYKVPSLTSATAYVTESALATYVSSTSGGPVSLAVDASSFMYYTGGIMSASTCAKVSQNHAVQLTGVYLDNSIPTSPNNYWKVRNQWSTAWGEAGYIRLQYGVNACILMNTPGYKGTIGGQYGPGAPFRLNV